MGVFQYVMRPLHTTEHTPDAALITLEELVRDGPISDDSEDRWRETSKLFKQIIMPLPKCNNIWEKRLERKAQADSELMSQTAQEEEALIKARYDIEVQRREEKRRNR